MGGFTEGVGVYGCGCEQYVGVYVGGGAILLWMVVEGRMVVVESGG